MGLFSAKRLLKKLKNKDLTVSQRVNFAIKLAGLMIKEAKRLETRTEKYQERQLARMMEDTYGKEFTTALADQCFRSDCPRRVIDQVLYLIRLYGVPRYLSFWKQVGFGYFRLFGRAFPRWFATLVHSLVRKETSAVILPGERRALFSHLEARKREGVQINLNHLGEAILGEAEALRRLNKYLEDLSCSEIETVSVKISTIFSQVNLLAWEENLDVLRERLRRLYRAANNDPNNRKMVNLDMEEYRDFPLTIALFQHVLDEAEFLPIRAGIVLQSYLPDAFPALQQLTLWAIERLEREGAPIHIRLVKGANLAMEQVESSLRGWPQAPFTTKVEVDANFKRMLHYACQKEHAKAVHIGVGSHNLFDIAYALILRVEKGVEQAIHFEMLEGMANPLRRVVQELAGGILLYCPTATKKDFQYAVAYLIRRLDENTGPENYLRHSFGLRPGTKEWDGQIKAFQAAFEQVETLSSALRRTQNRFEKSLASPLFGNEPDTDWTLTSNRLWAKQILSDWTKKTSVKIPNKGSGIACGRDPSCPEAEFYVYHKMTNSQVDDAVSCAKKAFDRWSCTPVQDRSSQLANVTRAFCSSRGELIGAMVADGGKTIPEADLEVSEAIDFLEYYRRNAEEIHFFTDLQWKSKGVVVVAPPWNFPCSIPVGGIAAALAAGNTVLFKPAPETVLVAWLCVQAFWKGGIDPEVLQFIVCDDEPTGSRLISDSRVDAVLLTGSTFTAQSFLRLRPGLDLMAETGGKNTLIVTDMADRDLAIRDVVQSAFGHAGQKCSACSLLILEAPVYDDPNFRRQLKEAAESLPVGSAWSPATKINPLIRLPGEELMRGLTRLEEGEEWLLKPAQDSENPQLWSPGIKWEVKEGGFTHQTELFGPILGVMRADDLKHAIHLANGTPYGLTAGIHTLDEREKQFWLKSIVAGNCYINRGITGAVVQRQPFGGCKASQFGPGAKAGGPNYVMSLMHPIQVGPPKEREELSPAVKKLQKEVGNDMWWQMSCESDAFYWKHYFSQDHDPSQIRGQENILHYVPRKDLLIRLQDGDSQIEAWRAYAAATICGAHVEFSIQQPHKNPLPVTLETDDDFLERIHLRQCVRFFSEPSFSLKQALAEKGCTILVLPPIANGRVELLRYLREVSISHDYHRYGNF